MAKLEEQKIVVLDFSTGLVHVFDYNGTEDTQSEEYENFLEEMSKQQELGRVSDCEWMVVKAKDFEIIEH